MSYDRFQINERDDGQFEVLEVTPITRGVIATRDIAEQFVNYLNLISEVGLSDRPTAPDTGRSPAPLDTSAFDAVDASDPVVAEPQTSNATVEPDQLPARTGETPLQEAFRRLEEGEKVGPVADDLGMPMPRLRAQWAARIKQHQRAATTDDPAPAAIGEDAECRICGRTHKVSMSSDGLCARCTRDVGD